MRARVCVPLVGGGRRLGYLWLFEDPAVSPDELRLARAAAAEAAALVGPDADAQLIRRRHEQQLVTALLSVDAAEAAAAAHDLEAEHYLPLRPLRVWVAAPGGPGGGGVERGGAGPAAGAARGQAGAVRGARAAARVPGGRARERGGAWRRWAR